MKQYVRLLEMDGVRLTFADDALDYIVDKAMEYKLGARGLRGLCETIMMDVMYAVPSSAEKTFEVTRAFAEQQIGKADMLKLQNAL